MNDGDQVSVNDRRVAFAEESIADFVFLIFDDGGHAGRVAQHHLDAIVVRDGSGTGQSGVYFVRDWANLRRKGVEEW